MNTLPTKSGADYRLLVGQAAFMAFIDNFRLFMRICLVCLPLVFLLQKVRPRRSTVAAH